MKKKPPEFSTQLEQGKRELSAELQRDVSYEEIAKKTELAYSTLLKHVSHIYRRPDYAIASAICDFFNSLSKKTRTPLEYFVQVEYRKAEEKKNEFEGQLMGARAA